MERMPAALLSVAPLLACPACSERPAASHQARHSENETPAANATQPQATRLENCVTSVGADRTQCVAR